MNHRDTELRWKAEKKATFYFLCTLCVSVGQKKTEQ